MEGKKIAVTGGSGMIGSHLVDQLAKLGNTVYIVDNLSRGRHLSEFGVIWVVDLEKRAPLFEGFDIVYHLAARVTGIEYNRRHHLEMYMKNQAINMNITDAILQSKPGLFVNVSTACVYPHDAPVPTPETAGAVCDPEPTNFGYGVAKWNGEQMTRMLHKEAGVPSMNVRFFNAFGPRDYYDEETSHVAPALIRRVLEGDNPVVVWGSGKQTRALVDCRDIARALVGLGDWAENSGAWPNYKGALTVNIGHHNEVSMRDLVFKIIELAGKEVGTGKGQVKVVFDRNKPDGYARRAADTTKLWGLLEWIPDTPLEVTLQDMIDDYRGRYLE